MKTALTMPTMNFTKQQLYDLCISHGRANDSIMEDLKATQNSVKELEGVIATQSTVIEMWQKHSETLKTQLDEHVRCNQAHVEAEKKWKADYETLRAHNAGLANLHANQSKDMDATYDKNTRMYHSMNDLRDRVQQLSNECAKHKMENKVLMKKNERLQADFEREYDNARAVVLEPGGYAVHKAWDDHVKAMTALSVDAGELLQYYMHCCTDGCYKSIEGESGAQWVPASGISGDRLYDHYVRWCWNRRGIAAMYRKSDMLAWMRARCTGNLIRDKIGLPLESKRRGIEYGPSMLSRNDWQIEDRLIPLDVTVPEYWDQPAPPAWAYGQDSDVEFHDCVSSASAPDSDAEDIDVLVADIEDKTVSARAMRLKKRNLKKRKKGRK